MHVADIHVDEQVHNLAGCLLRFWPCQHQEHKKRKAIIYVYTPKIACPNGDFMNPFKVCIIKATKFHHLE